MERFVGVGIVVAATIFYASLPVLVKKANVQLPPFTIMAISMFVLFVISFLASVIFEHSLQIKQQTIKANLPYLVSMGILNFFGFWLFILGFKYFHVSQQQMFSLLSPIFGGIFAYFLLGEAMSVRLFVGLAIMGVGLFVTLK